MSSEYYSNDLFCECPLVKHVSCNHLAVVVVFICRYRIIADPAGWLNVDKETGLIKVKNLMDRESSLVKEDKYTALIGAYDNGRWWGNEICSNLSCFEHRFSTKV